MKEAFRWRKVSGDGIFRVEEFLWGNESFCVTACSRYLRGDRQDHIWTIPGGNPPPRAVEALLLHSKRSLFPVFKGRKNIPMPCFLRGFLSKVPIHALQGLREDTETLEKAMEKIGYEVNEHVDYDLMALDMYPLPVPLYTGPRKINFRPPMEQDRPELLELQAGYEQEEVLPRGAVFNIQNTQISLNHILAAEKVLVAEMDGRIVGKINTSAKSFTRWQIGGVYVHPDYRGRGIATRMASIFIQDLVSLGWGITLFVKKRNPIAREVYQRIGLSVLADYRAIVESRS